MATMEKLTKALEALKVIQPPISSDESQSKKKENLSRKDKIIHCSTVADAICSHNLRSSSDFPKVLGFAMETFLLCCDDDDSDVRLMADECLNRTIKILLDSHLNRLQVELYKEIKKGGSARSLRAALSRFADLCHLIRPEKFRPYAVNLLPCFARICERSNEESIQDTLAASVSKVMPVLGQFTTDKEIKMLLKAFLPNVSNNSASVRRAAASSLIAVCQYSRRPVVFYSWLLSALFDMILPVQDSHSVFVILGVLLCLRHLVIHLNEATSYSHSKPTFGTKQYDEDMMVTGEQVLKIYEITLYYVHHLDHNVVTASLETLCQLLKNAPKSFQQSLVSASGIVKSSIYISEMNQLNRCLSESQSSVLPSSSLCDEAVLEDDRDLYISDKSDDEQSVCYEDTPKSELVHVDEYTGHIYYGSGESGDVVIQSSVKIPKLEENSFITNMPGVHTSGTPRKVPLALRKGAGDMKSLESEDDMWGDQNSTPSPSMKSEYQVGNIGSFTDADVPLKYCTRLLCSSFLLSGASGNLMPDRNVRVSVKSLALSCLSYVVSLYPKALFLELHLSTEGTEDPCQTIWDVVLFASHPDPHLKGQCALLLGNFIHYVLKESGGFWDKWVYSNSAFGVPPLEKLLEKVTDVVQDSSSVASKLGLAGLKQCLNAVLESTHGEFALPILEILLMLKTSYWLTKVELLDIIAEIPFKTVHYLESKQVYHCLPLQIIDFQTKFFRDIFIPLLGDEDFRVRQATATAIVKIIPRLFSPIDNPHHDPVVAKARENTSIYLDFTYNFSYSTLPLVHALVKPFCTQGSVSYCTMTEGALTRVINLLMKTLRTSTSKFLLYGCCQALCFLSESYLVTIYLQAWKSVFGEERSVSKPSRTSHQRVGAANLNQELSIESPNYNTADLINHLVALLTLTNLSLDLVSHIHTLQLTGNLLCGIFHQVLNDSYKNLDDSSPDDQIQNFVKNIFFVPSAEQIFIHLMRLLNIFAHILDEHPPILTSSRPTLPSLPNAPSLSPIKRKSKKDETVQSSGNSSTYKGSPNRTVSDKVDMEKERTNSKLTGSVGSFYSCPLYMKLYEILKGAHSSYKISMDFQSSEKFCQLLKCTLDVMAQILEVADSQEMGKHAEEILGYLKAVMLMEPGSSVQCVRQLLKSLFGTNLIALFHEAQPILTTNRKLSKTVRHPSATIHGLYHSCITAPYTKFTQLLANVGCKSGYIDGNDELMSSFSWMKRSDRLTNLLKSGSKGDKANLAAHIKLFEGVVIKALKLYTITSNVTLQCQVLDLLAQLVQLRVNYCLLDSDQIFIGFVLKQFEYIDEGQIVHADILIPRIFYFLVLLSYERYHSKSIISVPKILQLCDGLIASGQPPEKYVIQALQPVIEDLFLVRGLNKVDLCKELDALREVVISTLFKLINYPQVSEFFLLIVNQTFKEGEDKWKKLSRQIVDAILPLLARQQIQVDNQKQLDTLHKLLEAVSSNVFRPVDILLKALFTQPRDLNVCPNLHRWISMVLAILRIVITQTKEEVLLSRISDMGVLVKVNKLGATSLPFHSSVDKKDEKNVTSTPATPGLILTRFLFQVVGVTVETICCTELSLVHNYTDNKFVCQQMAHLLLYFMHMFQSGTFRKVTAAAMELVNAESCSVNSELSCSLFYKISEINSMFLKLNSSFPTLLVQWCNVLTLLNYDCQVFWSQILSPDDCHPVSPAISSASRQKIRPTNLVFFPCNLEIVRRAGIILLCDYVCENPNDAELMALLIVHHINDLIHLSLETTVQDFLSAVYRNAAASGLLIQAIAGRCADLSRPHFLKRAVCCLKTIHISQSGNLLKLLIEKFLPTRHVGLAQNCDSLACNRVEVLLADPGVVSLHIEDVDKLINCMISNGVSMRHQHLISLLQRLRSLVSGAITPVPIHPLAQSVREYKNTDLNKSNLNTNCLPLNNTPIPWHEPHDVLYNYRWVLAVPRQEFESRILDERQPTPIRNDWYTKYVKKLCFSMKPPVNVCSSLLSFLKYEDALGIMSSKEFHLSVLESSLKLGAEISCTERCLSSRSNDPFVGVKNTAESPLYRASRSTLLSHVTNFSTMFPRMSKHRNCFDEFFSNDSFWDLFCYIVSAASCYLKELKQLVGSSGIPDDSLEDIAKLSILCCEAISWMVKNEGCVSISSRMLETSLEMINTSFKNPSLFAIIIKPENVSWIFSATFAIHQLVSYLHSSLQISTVPFPEHSNNSLTQEQTLAQKSCIEIAEIVGWLECSQVAESVIPQYIYFSLRSVVRGLCRHPLVNSFARTPPILWQLGWTPEISGEYKTLIPPPPGEYLQDRDVLKQYIFRINLLGWISRQQFEETWMALLGVLSATPIDEVEGKEEDQERIRTSCLAVKSITSLLLQTLLLPEPGNPQNGSFLMQPRDKPLAFLHTKCGKKLLSVRCEIFKAIQGLMHQEKNDEELFNFNTERLLDSYNYSLSQVSLEYLYAAAGFLEENEDADESASSNSSPLSSTLSGAASYQQREQCLTTTGLDIHSCLHFLLDLYNQWLSPVACPYTPLTLLTAVVRSVVLLSDIFMEKSQFEWMLDTLLEVQRVHPAEDEIIAQYLIFGICKSAAVVGMEHDVLDRLKKLLELNLKSTYLPTCISTLHGLLYLLEQGSGDDVLPILTAASDYILKHLDKTSIFKLSSQNDCHLATMWAVAFYVMENFQEEISESDFSQKIFQLSLNICGSGDEDVPVAVYLTVLHGLERLLVAGVFSGKDVDHLLKLTVDRINSNSPVRSLAALGLLLSCMYIGKSSNLWTFIEPHIAKANDNSDANVKQLEADYLITALERVTTLFERIRKGYPLEAQVMCKILPQFLMEFFPTQDVLNKVIGEFLSSQQPHPQLIARVVYQVFQYLHLQSHEDVIQDWIMLSLSNFTQKSPLSMAIWCLSCFFISASSNTWLHAIFPFVQYRMGKIEEDDKGLFCTAGRNFRNQLKSDEQKQAYFRTVQSVAHPDNPYADLLSCL